MRESIEQLFNDYFQLKQSISMNISLGGQADSLPEQRAFEHMIPAPFKLASELKSLDASMLRPLRQLGDVIEPLAEYLKAQSRKIDVMMSYILRNEDDETEQFFAESFGGGGFEFISEHQYEIDNWLICKLFFEDDASAIYCLGWVLDKQPADNGFLYRIGFARIREQDHEIVVRAALHMQSKQLLKKTQRQDELE